MKELDEIKVQLATATPGPWDSEEDKAWRLRLPTRYFIPSAPQTIYRLVSALEAVLAVHRVEDHLCAQCANKYPCSTVRDIEKALNP